MTFAERHAMGADFPPELAVLLDGSSPAIRERAWPGFLTRYHRLLLKAVTRFGGDYDARMDRYRHLIESLVADDFHRLRAYHAQARSSFPAWLTVVARRLCVDFERARYGRGGRATADPGAARDARQTRRRLEALSGNDAALERIPGAEVDPESRLQEAERRTALHAVLAELDPRDRLLLQLRFRDGLAISQIAIVMGFPTVFHVYRRLRPLLDEVRRRLEGRGIHDAEF